MKKGFVIATAAMSLGIIAPLSQVATTTPVSAKTTSYSYVTTTNNSVSVTNIRKGSTITLLNNQNQAIATAQASKAGTINFKLSKAQVDQLTSTNVLAVKLSSGYKYNINFHFYGHSTIKVDPNGKAPVVKPSTSTSNKTNEKYSYVTTTSNSVSVTNIRKGSTVVLKNNLGQAIATKTAAEAGTVTFNLNASQVGQLTKTDVLAVKLSSGYKFDINFNFIGYQAPATNSTNNQSNNGTQTNQSNTTNTNTNTNTNSEFVSGIPMELQRSWQAKLGYFTGHWNMAGNGSTLTVNDPQILNSVQYKALGNHTYVLKGTENYYSGGTTVQYTVQRVSDGHLTLTIANGTSQWYR